MFDALRRMIFPIIIIVLVFFAGMIVLQWGAGLSSRQNYTSANLAAVINGEEISWQEYQRVYNNLYQSEVTQTQDELTDAKIRELQQTAWGQLLQDHLMTQQAAQREIMVTDDDVYAYLRFSPPVYLQQTAFFQTDGKFDYQKYLNAMVDPQAANFWNSIEPAVRSDIAKLKLQEMVVQTAYITEAEVRDAFFADQEKIKIGVVAVSQNKYRRDLPEPSEDDLLDYYDQHKDAYFSEERAILDYVLIR
ncbi:MAG: SurA N-terminal domain-containing protein, partial [candidate division Zixibacteria bacterium]|nr:SurA N-terminal domain-containing protein [candidate division Zixibacteria bacterium]